MIFFFQAEDGIRDGRVTGVQTCALPISTGLCVFTPVVCTASDQCHVAGTCDLATGQCSNPPALDGTPCNDGNLCTGENCQAGMCKPFIETICPEGTCDPATGVCK